MTMQKDNRTYILPTHTDERGSLTCLETSKDMPFEVKRVFWIYGIPEGKSRGEHAHHTCAELLFPVCGSFKVSLSDDGKHFTEYVLDTPNRGLLIPPMVWCRLYDFSADSVCLCLASEDYNREGYINTKDEFIALNEQGE